MFFQKAFSNNQFTCVNGLLAKWPRKHINKYRILFFYSLQSTRSNKKVRKKKKGFPDAA
jgi:hypothetical protein